jgi:hypothetical protein
VPTRETLCQDLGFDTDACATDEHLRDRLKEVFPVGTTESQLRDSLSRRFAGRSAAPQLSGPDTDGSLRLNVPYDVNGFAVCKESLGVTFQMSHGTVRDIDVKGFRTCL